MAYPIAVVEFSEQSISAKFLSRTRSTIQQTLEDALCRVKMEIVNEWPAYGVRHNLVVDGGLEFYSASLEQMCLSLNINWIAAPRRTPWFKGKIDRFLGTMNRSVAHGLPGTTFSDIFEKGD